MAQVFKLDGLLDVDALSAALGLVVERHTILRSRVVQDATGGPRLRVEPASTVRLQRTDLSYLAIGPAYEEAYRLRDADIDGRFDLAAGPWLRARLTELPEQRHLFTVVVHHIAVDATSMQIFWQELSQAYAAFTAGRRPELPELPIQYADYANLAARQLETPEAAAEVEYWKRTLAGATPTELRGDRARPAVRSSAGARVSHVIDPAAPPTACGNSRRGTGCRRSWCCSRRSPRWCRGTPAAGTSPSACRCPAVRSRRPRA